MFARGIAVRAVSVCVVIVFLLSSLLILAVNSRADSYWDGYLPQDEAGGPGIIDYSPNPYVESRVTTADGSCEVVMNAQLENCYWHENDGRYEADITPVVSVDTLGNVGYNIHQTTEFTALIPWRNVIYPDFADYLCEEIVFGSIVAGSPIFTFTYYGVTYDRILLSEYGYVLFGQSEGINTPFYQQGFPSTEQGAPDGVVAALWMDLDLDPGEVRCGFSSDIWPRSYSIAWWDVDSDDGTQRFVLTLREDGAILFDYLSVNVPAGSALIGYEDVIGSQGQSIPLSSAYSGSRVIVYPTPNSYRYVDNVFLTIDKRSGLSRDLEAAIEFTEDPAYPDRIFMPGFNLWTLDATPPNPNDEDTDLIIDSLDMLFLILQYAPIAWTPTGLAIITLGAAVCTIADFWLDFVAEGTIPPESSWWSNVAKTDDLPATAKLYAVDNGALPEGSARPLPTNFFFLPRFMWRVYDEDRSNDHSVTLDAIVTIRDCSSYNPLNPMGGYTPTSFTMNAGRIEFKYNHDVVDLTVTSPTQDVVWPPGSNQEIKWTNDGIQVSAVDLYLCRGFSEQYQIVQGTENDGSFPWTVPADSAIGDDYRIKIVPSDPEYASSYSFSSEFYISPNLGPKLHVRAIDMYTGEISQGSVSAALWPWEYYGGPNLGMNLRDDIILLPRATGVDAWVSAGNTFRFDHWEYEGQTYVNNPWPNYLEIYVDRDSVLTAYFVPIYSVSIHTQYEYYLFNMDDPSLGTTNPAPGEYLPYEGGTWLTVTALPAGLNLFSRFRISTDTGIWDVYDSIAPYSCTLLMDRCYRVTAYFITSVDLQITVTPAEGGTTSPSPGLCSDVCYAGEEVVVQAYPSEGYYFSFWRWDGCGLPIYSNPITIVPWFPLHYLKAVFYEDLGVTVDIASTAVNSPIVPLSITGGNGSIGFMEMSLSNDVPSDTAPWEPYSPTTEWTLSEGDGTKLVYVRVIDDQGVIKTAVTSVVLDTEAPITSLSLEAPIVTLSASDSTSGVASVHYRIDDGEWLAYIAPFALPSSAVMVYYYSVDNAGNAEEVKSTQVGPTVPSAPLSLVVTGYSGSITGPYAYLSWSYPEDDGGEITHWRLYRSTKAGVDESDWYKDIANTGYLHYSDYSVLAGKTYYYRISALNSAGESPLSNEDGDKVPKPTGGGGHPKPTTLTDSVDATWSLHLPEGETATQAGPSEDSSAAASAIREPEVPGAESLSLAVGALPIVFVLATLFCCWHLCSWRRFRPSELQ